MTTSTSQLSAVRALIRQLDEYRWPSGGEQPIAVLRLPLDRLAQQAGLRLEQWDEEGLGPARGAWCQLPSGRVVQLCEFDHAPAGESPAGTNVLADLGEVSRIGSDRLVDEVLQSFALGRTAVSWTGSAHPGEWIEKRLHGRRLRGPLRLSMDAIIAAFRSFRRRYIPS